MVDWRMSTCFICTSTLYVCLSVCVPMNLLPGRKREDRCDGRFCVGRG